MASASQQAAKAVKPALMGMLSASGADSRDHSVSRSALGALQMAQYQSKR